MRSEVSAKLLRVNTFKIIYHCTIYRFKRTINEKNISWIRDFVNIFVIILNNERYNVFEQLITINKTLKMGYWKKIRSFRLMIVKFIYGNAERNCKTVFTLELIENVVPT